jgi:lipopolysaccharide O-acetyltransferase
MLDRVRRFERENGVYVLGTTLLGFCASAARNYLLSRKLGVQKITIGPRAFLRGLSSIEMGEDFSAGPGLWLEAITRYNGENFNPKIVIGNHVQISHFGHIAATHLVEIGDNVLMGSKVMITDHNHGQYARDPHTSPHIGPTKRPLDRDRQVVVGRNVWLGDGVVVTPGSSIGEGSVIGANSVVLGSIPAFTIAAGIPATPRKIFNFASQRWCNSE